MPNQYGELTDEEVGIAPVAPVPKSGEIATVSPNQYIPKNMNMSDLEILGAIITVLFILFLFRSRVKDMFLKVLKTWAGVALALGAGNKLDRQQRIIFTIFCGAASAIVPVYNTLHPADGDYQSKLDLQFHPWAAVFGSIIPLVVLLPIFYWYTGRIGGERKTKNRWLFLIMEAVVVLGIIYAVAVSGVVHEKKHPEILKSAQSAFDMIPSPSGFVNGAGLSEAIRTRGMAGKPTSDKLIGVYYQPNTLAEMLKYGYVAPAPWGQAHLKREDSSLYDAKKEFRALVETLKKEKIDPGDPEVKKIFKRVENAAHKLDPSVSAKIDGMTVLGNILDKDTVYAFSFLFLANVTTSDGEADAAMPLAMSIAFMRLGRRQIEISVVYPFQDETSIQSANQTLLDWIKKIETQNSAQ